MQTAVDCYEMAEQCERQAAEVENDGARHVLLILAAQWRKLAEDLNAKE